MSRSKYCQNCGKPHDLTANFCISCGSAFVSLTAKPARKEEKPPVTEDEEDEQEDEVEDDDSFEPSEAKVPDIKKIEVDVRINGVNRVPLGGIISDRPLNIPSTVGGNLSKKEEQKNHKAQMEEYRKEATSLRKK